MHVCVCKRVGVFVPFVLCNLVRRFLCDRQCIGLMIILTLLIIFPGTICKRAADRVAQSGAKVRRA